jgi:hypothetical protein
MPFLLLPIDIDPLDLILDDVLGVELIEEPIELAHVALAIVVIILAVASQSVVEVIVRKVAARGFQV